MKYPKKKTVETKEKIATKKEALKTLSNSVGYKMFFVNINIIRHNKEDTTKKDPEIINATILSNL